MLIVRQAGAQEFLPLLGCVIFVVVVVLHIYREPTCLADILVHLQNTYGVVVPTTDEEWATIPRISFHIRRDKVLDDAMREAKKPRFNPTKLLNVS